MLNSSIESAVTASSARRPSEKVETKMGFGKTLVDIWLLYCSDVIGVYINSRISNA